MSQITLYNTLTRRKEPFEPLDPRDVRMYVCGPTVYDRAHLGNARPVLVFDTLYRLLRHVYGADHVTYVRNFTDVDDRINETAARRKAAGAEGTLEDLIAERSDETIAWYLDDMGALGALLPDHMPRATGYIAQMIAMIEDLIASGHAYAAEGHVLFAVDSYGDYGRLSGRSVDDMIAGARVEVAPYKKNPMDFVLWKPSTDDLPGWDSPWGRGRPGWHIECSAMAHELLGESFDIHGGGNDLAFPHHENEIAQSCCAYPQGQFARVWMHNEMLQVEGKKMSKSLGNFFTVRDLLDKYAHEFGFDNFGPAIRLRFLQTHYRRPIDFSYSTLEAAAAKLGHWWFFLDQHVYEVSPPGNVPDSILLALCDDLNTPAAIAEIDAMVSDLRRPNASGTIINDVVDEKAQSAADIIQALALLGLSFDEMSEFHQANRSNKRQAGLLDDLSSEIEALIEERSDARKEGNYKRADEIRDAFRAAGVEVQDTPGEPSKWMLNDSFDSTKLRALKSPDDEP